MADSSKSAAGATPCPDCSRPLDPDTGLCFSCAAGAPIPEAKTDNASEAAQGTGPDTDNQAVDTDGVAAHCAASDDNSNSDDNQSEDDGEEVLGTTPLLDVSDSRAKPPQSTVINNAKSNADEQPTDGNEPPPETGFGEEDEDQEARFFKELQDIKDNNRRLIVLLGFKGAGKTWLLHRIKEHYFETAPCIPPFIRVRANEGEKELPASDYFSFHTFATDPAFVILDTPGEYTKYLVEKDAAGINALRPLMAALDYASSLIVAMPADIAIFGPGLEEIDADALLKDEKIRKSSSDHKAFTNWVTEATEQSDELDEFAFGVHDMVAAMGLARQQSVDYTDAASYGAHINVDSVDSFVKDNYGKCPFEKPTFFALTKADRVISILLDPDNEADLFKTNGEEDEKLRKHMRQLRSTLQGKAMHLAMEELGLGDAITYPRNVPSKLLLRVRKRLQQRFLKLFPMARFDYVSSFFGHDFTNKIRKKHYEAHPPIGVAEMTDWMRQARNMDGNNAPRISDYEKARDHHLRWNGMNPNNKVEGM